MVWNDIVVGMSYTGQQAGGLVQTCCLVGEARGSAL